MQATHFEITSQPPTARDFMLLRSCIGWGSTDVETTIRSIQNTLYWVSIYIGGQLVATGRVIGDGAMYFYIQDIIVHPDFQRRGFGTTIMEAIQKYLSSHCVKGANVDLIAVQGKEEFYRKFGYVARSGDSAGLSMCKLV